MGLSSSLLSTEKEQRLAGQIGTMHYNVKLGNQIRMRMRMEVSLEHSGVSAVMCSWTKRIFGSRRCSTHTAVGSQEKCQTVFKGRSFEMLIDCTKLLLSLGLFLDFPWVSTHLGFTLGVRSPLFAR